MSKAKIDKEKLLQKIKTLSGTSRCIQKTSKYLYQFYKSSDIIVQIWLEALNSGPEEARIPLFYIANEMLQSKSYGNGHFKKSWKPYLVHSIDCIKDSYVNDKIRRILNIWIERKVYEKSFVDDLINRLSTAKRNVKNEQQCKEIIMNFKPEECIRKLKELINVESQTIEPIKQHEASINFDEKSFREAIKNLKDKLNSNHFSEQLDQNINHLFQLCTMLDEELKIRQKTFEAMNNAEIYYETQQKETLIVEDAYRRYGMLISKTKSSLEEHLEFLMDDGGPMDVDDAPSPGKTPPQVYNEAKKPKPTNIEESPMYYDDEDSPELSVTLSEDDASMDDESHIDKPYSPSHHVQESQPPVSKPKTSLSSSEAFKLLTSVFSQSLTKKPLTDVNANVNLQPDVFHNTLAPLIKTDSENKDSKTPDKEEKSDSVLADAFRIISTLTGLKNVRERTSQSEPTSNIGTTIPILTTKMSFKSSDECSDSLPNNFNYNSPNYPTTNVLNTPDNIPRLLYPDMQMSSFPAPMFNQQPVVNNQMYSMFNQTSRPPPPLPALFNTLSNNPLAFTMPPIRQSNQQNSQSPGSCTEDEDDGGATPTQDEIARLNTNTLPINMFNKNLMPGGQDNLNKHMQHALSTGTMPFNLPPMLPATNDPCNNPMQQPPPQSAPWHPMTNHPFTINNGSNSHSFPTNMAMPFSLMSQSAQMQPIFNQTSVTKPTFAGPPRAIRTKRPTAVDSADRGQSNADDDSDSGSLSPAKARSPWPQSAEDDDDDQGEDSAKKVKSIGGSGNGKW